MLISYYICNIQIKWVDTDCQNDIEGIPRLTL